MHDEIRILGKSIQEIYGELVSRMDEFESMVRDGSYIDFVIGSPENPDAFELSASLDGSTLDLDHILLSENLRRKGLGRAFFYYFEPLVFERGVELIRYLPSLLTDPKFQDMLLKNGYVLDHGYYVKRRG